ncbi:hypothetical protein D3C72_1818890 [compost metagenome]
MPAPPVVAADVAEVADIADIADIVDDGGPRRQPELAEAIVYSPDHEPSASDLALLDDDDLPLPLPRELDPAMQRAARLAALDPDDGIQL